MLGRGWGRGSGAEERERGFGEAEEDAGEPFNSKSSLLHTHI
jgi:hypothetical protein